MVVVVVEPVDEGAAGVLAPPKGLEEVVVVEAGVLPNKGLDAPVPAAAPAAALKGDRVGVAAAVGAEDEEVD